MDDNPANLAIRLWAMLILLGMSGFFSSCEAAFFSLNPARVKIISETRGRVGATIASLLAEPRELLITIYIGNEIVNVAIAAMSTFIALDLFNEAGVALAVGFMTFLLLIFGEIAPKTLAMTHAETAAALFAIPLKMFYVAITPVRGVVSAVAAVAVRLAGGSTAEKPHITEEEFRTLVKIGESEGQFDSDERAMIHKLFDLAGKTVRDIMTPWSLVFSLDMSIPPDKLVERASAAPYSRIPLTRGTEATIAGVFYKKDIFRLPAGGLQQGAIESIMRKPYVIPAGKKINELLREFRKNRIHFAIVCTDTGEITGVVTMDDVMEELVGPIEPGEAASEKRLAVKQKAENVYSVPAEISIPEFNAEFHAEIEAKHSLTTVIAHVTALLGRQPRWGDSVQSGRFRFAVAKARGSKITRFDVTVSPKTGEEER